MRSDPAFDQPQVLARLFHNDRQFSGINASGRAIQGHEIPLVERSVAEAAAATGTINRQFPATDNADLVELPGDDGGV